MPEAAVSRKNQVRLGRELQLIRSLPARESVGFVVRPVEMDRIPPYSPRAPMNINRTGIDQAQFIYELEPTEAESHVSIEGKGLFQSFGIFGVPGCGKTYLLMHLLRQLLGISDDPEYKFGALILDPKAALIEDIIDIVRAANREKDLVVVNERHMREQGQAFNVIECFLKPWALGKALSMAAQSAGVSARDPYWMNNLGLVLGAAVQVLSLMQSTYKKRPTIRDVAKLLLDKAEESVEPFLDEVLADAAALKNEWSMEDIERFANARGILKNFLADRDHAVMSSFVEMSYGLFRDPDYRMFSADVSAEGTVGNLYDSVINEGKIILVSVSRSSLAISKILCTLIKTLFQQVVLNRRERCKSGELTNMRRPLLFAADEYSDVATEVEGQPFGDGAFFSMCREFQCMGIVATQSVHMLKNSGLKDAWHTVFANMAAKIFMQLGDADTAEEASKLVGESEFRFQTFNRSIGKEGSTENVQFDIKEKKDLPTRVLLQTLARGQAVVIGSADGVGRPATRFIRVGG